MQALNPKKIEAEMEVGVDIEMGMEVVKFGQSSLTLKCLVRNKVTKEEIITIDKIVFVNLDADGKPQPHGKVEVINDLPE